MSTVLKTAPKTHPRANAQTVGETNAQAMTKAVPTAWVRRSILVNSPSEICLRARYTFVDSNTETPRSYAAVHDASLRVARALRELGLRRGDLVTLVIGDPERFLTSLFGASIAGVVPASLYPPAPTSSLTQYLAATAGLLRSCGARAVVTTAGLLPHFEGLRTTCPKLSVVVAAETLDVAVDDLLRRLFDEIPERLNPRLVGHAEILVELDGPTVDFSVKRLCHGWASAFILSILSIDVGGRQAPLPRPSAPGIMLPRARLGIKSPLGRKLGSRIV